jgi:hypothetical protein
VHFHHTTSAFFSKFTIPIGAKLQKQIEISKPIQQNLYKIHNIAMLMAVIEQGRRPYEWFFHKK